MAQRPGIFPTFFLSGFECSSFLWGNRIRRNLVAETGHDRHAAEDYRFLASLGIAVAREGIPWPMVDKDGGYDFSSTDRFIEAMNASRIIPIWDLCHYGYPDELDPFSDEFVTRFAAYCRAAAEYVIPKVRGPHFFTPINEITFFSYCAGEWGWAAPYHCTCEDRMRLLEALCRAAIAGVKAIREVDPEARMVHVDPLVQVVAPRDRPDQVEAARHETYVDTFLAWDIICGREHPEFGGSPEILDIVGVNNYSFGQMEYREQGPHAPLPPGDDRIAPLAQAAGLADDHRRDPRPGPGARQLAQGRHGRIAGGRAPGHGPAGDLPIPRRRHAGLAYRRVGAQRHLRRGRGKRRPEAGAAPGIHRRIAPLAEGAEPGHEPGRGSVQRPGGAAGCDRRGAPAQHAAG